MKGFKALNRDMTSKYGDMEYNMGVDYKMDDNIIACLRGYHFCEELEKVWNYYSTDSRIFEVEVTGKIVQDDDKYVTNEIKLVREVSQEEIKDYIENNIDRIMKEDGTFIKQKIVRLGLCLDKLIDDEDYIVRWEVARQGYRLEKLVDDEDCDVRCEVAKQGYGLEKLINDEDCDVRWEVARQGYGLEKLMDDEDFFVSKTAKYEIIKIKKKENAFGIIFYTTHCPKCRVLERKLKELNIEYLTETDKDKMLELGIKEVPVLSVGGKLYNFKEAVGFLKLVGKFE